MPMLIHAHTHTPYSLDVIAYVSKILRILKLSHQLDDNSSLNSEISPSELYRWRLQQEAIELAFIPI